jgi:hypothetical protein
MRLRLNVQVCIVRSFCSKSVLKLPIITVDLQDFVHDNSQRQLLEHINLGMLRKEIISQSLQVGRTSRGEVRDFLRNLASNILSIAERILNNVPQKDHDSLVKLFIWNPQRNTDELEVINSEENLLDSNSEHSSIPAAKKRKMSDD